MKIPIFFLITVILTPSKFTTYLSHITIYFLTLCVSILFVFEILCVLDFLKSKVFFIVQTSSMHIEDQQNS